ncbi:hypothetical protein XENORESO_010187 [Xenotaenia resolanae]|uniref:Uncharacterized protein n=1 Tax=Xenotaenia resolanae TaxID=208358 RepID=A0ABV0WDW8_9TELE
MCIKSPEVSSFTNALSSQSGTRTSTIKKSFDVTEIFNSSIHPFSIPTSSILGHEGAGAYLQQSTGERRGTARTGPGPEPEVELRTFLLQGNSATNCTTVQPYIQFTTHVV